MHELWLVLCGSWSYCSLDTEGAFSQPCLGCRLLLPLAALLGFAFMERSYLQVVFYDFTNQLLPEHRFLNLLWCKFYIAAWVFEAFSSTCSLALHHFVGNPPS